MKNGVAYSGKCEGGPYDGRMLYHADPAYHVAMVGTKVMLFVRPKPTDPVPEMMPMELRFGTYHHKDGVWRWSPPSQH